MWGERNGRARLLFVLFIFSYPPLHDVDDAPRTHQQTAHRPSLPGEWNSHRTFVPSLRLAFTLSAFLPVPQPSPGAAGSRVASREQVLPEGGLEFPRFSSRSTIPPIYETNGAARSPLLEQTVPKHLHYPAHDAMEEMSLFNAFQMSAGHIPAKVRPVTHQSSVLGAFPRDIRSARGRMR